MLIVIVILGILAGMSFLAFGRSSDNAKAAGIMADLDAAKNALLTYSMEHRRRNVEPLGDFKGVTTGGLIQASLDKYLDGNMDFNKLRVREVESGTGSGVIGWEVGFLNIGVTSGVENILKRKITTAGGYTDSGAGETYSVWLRIR